METSRAQRQLLGATGALWQLGAQLLLTNAATRAAGSAGAVQLAPGRLAGGCSPAGQGLTGAGSEGAVGWGRSPDGGTAEAPPPSCRRPCPSEMQCWPPGTPASAARSVRSCGHPAGQARPRAHGSPGGWPRGHQGGAGRVGRSLSLPVSRICPQPARGHGPGWRGDLHQRLGQPPRVAQSPRQGGSGDHGHHQGRRWAAMLERVGRGQVCPARSQSPVPGQGRARTADVGARGHGQCSAYMHRLALGGHACRTSPDPAGWAGHPAPGVQWPQAPAPASAPRPEAPSEG